MKDLPKNRKLESVKARIERNQNFTLLKKDPVKVTDKFIL